MQAQNTKDAAYQKADEASDKVGMTLITPPILGDYILNGSNGQNTVAHPGVEVSLLIHV